MEQQNKFFALEGKVQHYQWGGFTYIPRLLSLSNDSIRPYAEYWLGAHSQAPAIVIGNGSLDKLLESNPDLLGEKVKRRFGRLPYLLKVLDVKDMLSIQVHPSRESAKAGFAAENAAGIPLNAPNRNYKDDNHKPELAAAIGDFWLLHGFRGVASMKNILQDQPELQFLLPIFGDGNYEAVYRTVMEMEEEQVKKRLTPMLDRLVPLYQADRLSKSDPGFWAARAALTFNQPGKIDRGIFSVFLLNLVFLKEGEAIFQDAGILHAYLDGQNIEIMANSDNVLRGGLTPKHIDVPELMKHVRFSAVEPDILAGVAINAYEKVFRTPADDFELHEIHLQLGDQYEIMSHTAEILLVLEGRLKAKGENETGIDLNRGGSLFLADGAKLRLESNAGAIIYKATVPGT